MALSCLCGLGADIDGVVLRILNMNRRGFFQSLAAGACGAVMSSRSKADDLELVDYSAAGGFRARVWLNGKECEYVKAMVASINPGDEVEGKVLLYCTDHKGKPYNNGHEMQTQQLTGRVRWEHLD